jgi:5-methylcytosine-specific restriction endonuclease McrA
MRKQCPSNECEFETESNRGLSIHFTQKHPDQEYDFTDKKEFTCPQCGDTFKDYESRRSSKNESQNFCSRACKDSFEARDGLDTECAECGDQIHIPPSQTEQVNGYKQRNYFCNKECESSFKKREWQGENHPKYNGGQLRLFGPNWHEQRSKTIKQDNEKCQECGMTMKEHQQKHDQELHVHHKVPRKQILSDDPTEDEFALANSLDNLVTLCVSCHTKRE